MSLTKADLQKIISELQDIPPPSDEERILSQNEIINKLRPIIKKLRTKGYTPSQIERLLNSSSLGAEVPVTKRQIEHWTKRRTQTKRQPLGLENSTATAQGNSPSSHTSPKGDVAEDDAVKQRNTHSKTRSDSELKGDPLASRSSSYFTPDPDKEDI